MVYILGIFHRLQLYYTIYFVVCRVDYWILVLESSNIWHDYPCNLINALANIITQKQNSEVISCSDELCLKEILIEINVKDNKYNLRICAEKGAINYITNDKACNYNKMSALIEVVEFSDITAAEFNRFVIDVMREFDRFKYGDEADYYRTHWLESVGHEYHYPINELYKLREY
ncbi:MAG: hypothetical protein AB9835_01955 [Eubacteriales bacterium]